MENQPACHKFDKTSRQLFIQFQFSCSASSFWSFSNHDKCQWNDSWVDVISLCCDDNDVHCRPMAQVFDSHCSFTDDFKIVFRSLILTYSCHICRRNVVIFYSLNLYVACEMWHMPVTFAKTWHVTDGGLGHSLHPPYQTLYEIYWFWCEVLFLFIYFYVLHRLNIQ